jgi:riboflavin biosynthesis pyrimidine reductase
LFIEKSRGMRITNVMGISLDGAIAAHAGESDEERAAYGFHGPEDAAHVRAMLRETDAVLVGGASVAASGGVMEVINDRGVCPTWMLATRTGFAEDSPVWRAPRTPKWVLSPHPLPTDRALHADRCIDGGLSAWLSAASGFERVLLFGGGAINRMCYAAGVVDALVLTVCPILLGSEDAVPVVAPGLTHPVKFRLEQVRASGNFAFLHYSVLR